MGILFLLIGICLNVMTLVFAFCSAIEEKDLDKTLLAFLLFILSLNVTALPFYNDDVVKGYKTTTQITNKIFVVDLPEYVRINKVETLYNWWTMQHVLTDPKIFLEEFEK